MYFNRNIFKLVAFATIFSLFWNFLRLVMLFSNPEIPLIYSVA